MLSVRHLGIICAIAGSLAACFGCQKGGSISRDDLKIDAGDLGTFASAGSLLCEQYMAGNTTDTFFRNQSEMLRDKVRSGREAITGSAGVNEPQRRQAAEIADKLETTFGSLYDDPSTTASASSELQRLTTLAKGVEESLK